MEDPEVRRFAVKFEPPTLVVEYRSRGALFLKKIRIKQKKQKMDAEILCDKIIEKNKVLLGPNRVCRTQLLDLVSLILQEMGKSETDGIEAKQIYDRSEAEEDYKNVDLNKFGDDELSKVKSLMDVNFQKNRVCPNDPDFVWNKEVEFEEPKEDCDWDEESD